MIDDYVERHSERIRIPSPWAPDTSRPCLVVVDDRRPTPQHDSGSRRLTEILHIAQASGWSVVMCPVHMQPTDALYDDQDLGLDVTIPVAALRAQLRRWGASVTCFWIAHPEQWSAYAGLLRRACPTAALVFDTVDIHSERLRAQARVNRSWLDHLAARRVGRMERAAVAGADVTVAVTAEEEAVVRRWKPGARTALIPNLHVAATSVAQPGRQRTAVTFVGSFGHAPNVDAARFITTELAPRIRERLPDAEILIVGAQPPIELCRRARPPVRFTGWVEDIGEIYDKSRVAIAPLRYGAGLKGKVGEALANGVPVVTTPVGAEGFGAVSGTHLLIANDAIQFTDAIARLCEDDETWTRISAAGADLIRRQFSVEAVAERVRALLAELT